MIPVHWKRQKDFLPEDDISYLVAENGIFRVKRNPVYTASIRLEVVPETVMETLKGRGKFQGTVTHEECVLIHPGQEIPWRILQELLNIFRWAWNEHQSEIEAQLYFDEVTEQWHYKIPRVFSVREGLFCYYLIPPTPKDCLRMGSIHSHGSAGACQSIVDWKTEAETDGVHITLGDVCSAFPSADARIVVDGVSFSIDPSVLFEEAPEPRLRRLPELGHFDPEEYYPPGSPEADAVVAYNEAWRMPRTVLVRGEEKEMPERVHVLIGLGGIGSGVAPILCHWLEHHEPGAVVLLVDGKRFEPRKAERQIFPAIGNKAEVLAKALREEFGRLDIRHWAGFVDGANVSDFVPEGGTVFLMPDNHATRRIVSRQAETLKNILLISGGNDALDEETRGVEGTIMVHLRRGSRNITAPITEYHPEIAEAGEVDRRALGCAEMARSVPQLFFTNQSAVTHMLNTFYAARQKRLTYGELWFNIETGETTTYKRPPGRTNERRDSNVAQEGSEEEG